MGTISVDKIRPGMVLEKPVTTAQGKMLLPAGTVISDRHLYLFKSWGISGADIEGAGESQEDDFSDLTDEERESVEHLIYMLFPYEDLDPLNEELKRAATVQKIQQIKRTRHKNGYC
jgi:hypothetical protein